MMWPVYRAIYGLLFEFTVIFTFADIKIRGGRKPLVAFAFDEKKADEKDIEDGEEKFNSEIEVEA